MLETVVDGAVVLIVYQLADEAGKPLGGSDEPLAYLHGRGNIVAGLEEALAGRKVGERVQVTVPPERGYGLPEGPGPQSVPRKEFPRDVDLRAGMSFRAEGSDGKPMQLWITKVLGSRVWVDRNHPLAGKTLAFDVSILAIREATHEEAEHGHAHGLHGFDVESDES